MKDFTRSRNDAIQGDGHSEPSTWYRPQPIALPTGNPRLHGMHWGSEHTPQECTRLNAARHTHTQQTELVATQPSFENKRNQGSLQHHKSRRCGSSVRHSTSQAAQEIEQVPPYGLGPSGLRTIMTKARQALSLKTDIQNMKANKQSKVVTLGQRFTI